jgi:hypothetical protein
MFLQMEKKKVSRLINEKGYIPVLNGKVITLLIGRDGKTYRPKKELCII